MSAEIDAGDVFGVVSEVIKLNQMETQCIFELGKRLSYLKEGKRYKQYGTHIKRMEDLYKDIGMSERKGQYAMRIYRVFGELSHDVKDWTRLIPALEYCEKVDTEEKSQILRLAGESDNHAVTNYIRSKNGKITHEDCDHPDQSPFSKCNVCGKFLRVV